MKWVLFTGTFRLTDKRVEADVREAVREVIARGDGVLTGGATGVDYFAMDEAFRLDPTCAHLKVIIPADLESYIEDNRANGVLFPLTMRDIDNLARLLWAIKRANPRNLVEMPYTTITQEHYDLRDREEVRAAQEVYAFQVNGSTGTQDTIRKAVANGIKISLHKQYRI
ncbi:MAG TPA: hypothetical protein VFQ72_01155 [Candidatus Paceibacterota bacterium]|nr:hypothetical protein [Candidatus Paceibacterota bacterium]